MAIPWLIGAAVVAIGAAIVSSSDDDDRDYERDRRERELERERIRKEKEAVEAAEKKRVSIAVEGFSKKYKVPEYLVNNQLALYKSGSVDAVKAGESLCEYADEGLQVNEQIEQSEELMQIYGDLLLELDEAEAELMELMSVAKLQRM